MKILKCIFYLGGLLTAYAIGKYKAYKECHQIIKDSLKEFSKKRDDYKIFSKN